MKIVITGGAGFIGSNFIYYMLSKHPEDEIICIDSLTYAGNLAVLSPIMEKIQFYKADIRDRDEIFRIFKDICPDIIVNFAAESHVDRSIDNPAVFLETNFIGTSVLLDAFREYGRIRFHQISTDEVYGDLPLDRKDLKFTESSPIHPNSPYSASKASADLLVLSYHRTYGLNVTISRCSNNFGPYQNEEKLIPKTIKLASEDKPIPIYGNGLNIRDWIYVKDNCKPIYEKIYNGSGDNGLNNISAIRKILTILGKPENLKKYAGVRKAHNLRYALDSSKTESTNRIHVPFHEALEKTVRAYAITERS